MSPSDIAQNGPASTRVTGRAHRSPTASSSCRLVRSGEAKLDDQVRMISFLGLEPLQRVSDHRVVGRFVLGQLVGLIVGWAVQAARARRRPRKSR